MSSTKGPTEVKGARMLTAIKTIPTVIIQGANCRRTFACDSVLSPLSNGFNIFIRLPLFIRYEKMQGLVYLKYVNIINILKIIQMSIQNLNQAYRSM